ncbi:MAG TPA: helix-turn-helix domain-containing protein [Verrucomicrobiae bacterium]|nr:helix-turn-helix domain-containing protein [Verrucomicrobiae bacterium]
MHTSRNEAALTVEELAAQIKYHPESVRRAIRQGRINALRFGAGWRIPAREAARILTTGLPYSSDLPATLNPPSI